LAFTASLLDVQHLKGLVWDKPASSLVVSLGKAARQLIGLPLPLSGWTGSNKWQLDLMTEKGHFAVSWSRYLDKK